jgi:DeoR/GlpR family transcriptional regulator of sugar metabolism
MLIDERRHLIAESVLARGSATVAELSEELGVSLVTIRSDLEALEQQGILRRNRGGAVTNPAARFAPAFQERSSVNRSAKETIGKAAAALVQNGDWILLDAGSTTLYAVDHLKGLHLTVAVNSIYSANKFVDSLTIDLIQIGGLLYRPSLCFVGKPASAHLGEFHFDRLLLGVNGVADSGLWMNNCVEVGIKQKMIDCADEIIVLADASKLGHTSLARIASLRCVHKLVTDASASQDTLGYLLEVHPSMEVIIA